MPPTERAELIVDLKLRDQLTGGIAAAKTQLTGLEATAAKLGSTATSTGTSLGGLGASFGAIAKAGIGALVVFKAIDVASDFFGNSVSGAIEEEKGIARLTASLKANVPAWDEDTAAVERAVKANERFGFSDGEVRDALAGLVAATHDQAKALDLLSTAQDLARLRGVSLKEASQALVTIEAGRFRGLAQLGIQLRAGATQEEALAAVRAVAAGQAAKFGETTEGAMADASVAVKNLEEDFGTLLLPVIKETANFVRSDLIPAVRDVGGAVAAIIGPINDARQALRDLGTDIPDFLPFIGPQLRLVAAAKAGAAAAKENVVAIVAQRKAALDYVEAQNAVTRAVADGTISVEEGERQAAALDDQLRHLAASTMDAGRASLLAAEQHDRLAGAAGTATSSVTILSDAEVKSALAAGETADAHARLNDILGLTAGHFGALPDKALAGAGGLDAEAVAAQEAAAATFGLGTELANLPREVNVDINVNVRRRELTTAFGIDREEPGGPGGLSNQEYLAELARQKAAEDAAARDAAKAAADKATASREQAAKQRASELAAAYREDVADAFDAAKRRADTLFDSLHDRHVKAIKDAETLAERQHDAALQAISDDLKAQQSKNSAPVDAAEKALNDRQAAQQRRNLVEAAQAAQEAVTANRDPGQSADLARALRSAKESLENFDAASVIDRLKVSQATLDAAAEGEAKTRTDAADNALASAKAQAQKDLDAETIANQKRKADFEVALAALKDRDLKSGRTPKQLRGDISALENRFGITTDPLTGAHHINDPLVNAIKTIRIPAPIVNNIFRPQLTLRVNSRDLIAALASNVSPTATPGVRTGQGGRQ